MNPTNPKPVLITGCASGIGHYIAKTLHQKGYRVFATVRTEIDAEALKAEGISSLILDLSNSDSIRQGVEQVFLATEHKLYALVNNGAYAQFGAAEDLSREALREQFETNVFGTQELTNRVIPVMRAAGDGRIIQISSILGLLSLAYRGAYSASKYALESLSDCMRLELAGTGIHVSIVEPGPIHSHFRANAHRMYQKHLADATSHHRETYNTMERRLLDPKPIRFSLSPEAVANKVIHALESPRPRCRYRVTTPARAMALMKRVLPDRWLDHLLLRWIRD